MKNLKKGIIVSIVLVVLLVILYFVSIYTLYNATETTGKILGYI